MDKTRAWNLVADIGGTNARFGVQCCSTGDIVETQVYPVSEYERLAEVMRAFLSERSLLDEWSRYPAEACIAVAGPVEGDSFAMTNCDWHVSVTELSALVNGAKVDVINDFVAVGYGLVGIDASDWEQVGAGGVVADMPIAILGPGTGFGVGAILPTPAGTYVLESAGGHVDFAPVSETEIALLRILSNRYDRVSVERLLSGDGIVTLYEAMSEHLGRVAEFESAAEITRAAIDASDDLASETLGQFCAILGSVAGDIALTLGAKGGVYIAGGIVPRFSDFLRQSEFRARFESKGRFRSYVSEISTRLVLKQDLGLLGASMRLADARRGKRFAGE